jgi:hypothetical protein
MNSASTIAALYKAISAGNKIQLELADRAAFESIRTGLCRAHRTPKALDLINGSVRASFDEDSGVAIFHIGLRKNLGYQFSIVAEPAQSDDSNEVSDA